MFATLIRTVLSGIIRAVIVIVELIVLLARVGIAVRVCVGGTGSIVAFAILIIFVVFGFVMLSDQLARTAVTLVLVVVGMRPLARHMRLFRYDIGTAFNRRCKC